jgi:hypothetical protein
VWCPHSGTQEALRISSSVLTKHSVHRHTAAPEQYPNDEERSSRKCRALCRQYCACTRGESQRQCPSTRRTFVELALETLANDTVRKPSRRMFWSTTKPVTIVTFSVCARWRCNVAWYLGDPVWHGILVIQQHRGICACTVHSPCIV